MKYNKLSLSFSNKSNYIYIIAITMSAFLIRLIIAMAYYNQVDLLNYNISWMDSLKDGLFDVYERNSSIDYPPIYLILLYPLSFLLNIDAVLKESTLLMLVLKIVPVIIDTLMIPLIWYIFNKRSPKTAIFVASLWAVNVSGIINSSLWGQTDTIMAFILILSFYFLENDKPILGGIMFALCAVTKFQALYFAPIVFLELITKYNWKKVLKSIGAGVLLGIIVFIPFMIGSKYLSLVFDLYLGGFDKYSYATLNAFNFYGVIGLNAVPTNQSFGYGYTGIISDLFKWLRIDIFGLIMMILSIALIVFLYFKAKRKSIWVFSFLFMQCIFMLTTKMHERYQFIVVPLCLIAAFMHDDMRFFKSYIALTVITAINQFALLLAYNNSQGNIWYNSFGNIVTIFSIVNFLIFIYTVFITVKWCFEKPSHMHEDMKEITIKKTNNMPSEGI